MVPLFSAAHKIMVPLFDAAYTDLGLQKKVLNALANGKIQGLLKALGVFKNFSRQILFSRTFPDSLVYSSTFEACTNPLSLHYTLPLLFSNSK